MPVTDQTPVNSSTGNGVTTVFAYTFKILDQADIAVYVDDVLQTLTTHYTVSGVGSDSGGNVTFVSAPASGAVVVRLRDMDYARATDYQDGGDLLASTLDDDQDSQTMMMQQLSRDLKRSLKLPKSVTTNQELTEESDATARAGQLVGFDGSGNLALSSSAAFVTAAIADGSVTAAKLAADAVNTASILDDAVTVAKIAFGPVQRVVETTTAFATTSTTIPLDDTIPQNSEGGEFLTASITPLHADSTIVVEVVSGVVKTNSVGIWALFKDSGADAIAAKVFTGGLYSSGGVALVHEEVAGSTSARTYRVRGGPTGAGTVDINGSGVRLMGGVSAFRMVITEWRN